MQGKSWRHPHRATERVRGCTAGLGMHGGLHAHGQGRRNRVWYWSGAPRRASHGPWRPTARMGPCSRKVHRAFFMPRNHCRARQLQMDGKIPGWRLLVPAAPSSLPSYHAPTGARVVVRACDCARPPLGACSICSHTVFAPHAHAVSPPLRWALQTRRRCGARPCTLPCARHCMC